MRIIATMPVRNEAWCLAASLSVAMQWCDGVAVGLHECTDDSARIVERFALDFPGRIRAHVCAGAWDEMQHRQELLTVARQMSATHIAIIDADEILTANIRPVIRNMLAGMPRGAILTLPGYNLRDGLDRYHYSGVWAHRWFSCAFHDAPELLWSGDMFHHREPMGARLAQYRAIAQGAGGIMHLWGASERRLRAKHALYKLTERQRWPHKSLAEIDSLYNLAIHQPREVWTYRDVADNWWGPERSMLDLEAVPWQEAEVRRLVEANGRPAEFDLFGVV